MSAFSLLWKYCLRLLKKTVAKAVDMFVCGFQDPRRTDRLNGPVYSYGDDKLSRPGEQERFGGQRRHTIHYIGVPVGYRVLSKSGPPHTARQGPCVAYLTYFSYSLGYLYTSSPVSLRTCGALWLWERLFSMSPSESNVFRNFNNLTTKKTITSVSFLFFLNNESPI